MNLTFITCKITGYGPRLINRKRKQIQCENQVADREQPTFAGSDFENSLIDASEPPSEGQSHVEGLAAEANLRQTFLGRGGYG